MITRYCSLILLFLSVGCGIRRSGRIVTVSSSFELSEEERAKLHDLPFLAQVKPQKLLFTKTQTVLSYEINLSSEELIHFFTTGMEYWGWQQLGLIESHESCLLFSKPSKIAAVTLRQNERGNVVTLFVTLKKDR